MYVRPLLWKSLPLLIPSCSHNPHQCNCFHLLTIFNQASIYTASLHLFLARLSLLLKTSFLVPTCLWPLLHHQPSVPDYENCLLFTAPVLPVPPSPTKVSRSWSWPSSHLNHCSACVIPAVTLIYLILLFIWYRYHWIDASATSRLRLKRPNNYATVWFHPWITIIATLSFGKSAIRYIWKFKVGNIMSNLISYQKCFVVKTNARCTWGPWCIN